MALPLLSHKVQNTLCERNTARCAHSLPAFRASKLRTCGLRRMFSHAQVAGEHGVHLIRVCGRELCETLSVKKRQSYEPCLFLCFPAGMAFYFSAR